MRDLMDRLERFYGALPMPPADPFAYYVWEVLGARTTPNRRDAAMGALRRIPALTPDSMSKAARAKVEKAVGLAGPHREERLRALTSGIEAFKRNRDLSERICGDIADARSALDLLPHLTPVSRQWMLLFAGRQSALPEDPNLNRVFARLRTDAGGVSEQLGGVLTAVQRATIYVSHHGRGTCLETDPLCHICPLRIDCPFPEGAAA